MSDPVEVRVRSSLQKIIDELDAVNAKAKETGEAFKQTGPAVGDELNKNVKRTETFFSQLRSLSRRVADQLRGDFKSLVSINAITDALKISGQFRNSIEQTVELNDTIRKLGTTFGIASSDFVGFQAKMTEGLGDIGLSADVAAEALKGLSTTPVRGQENLLAYSQSSGMLASISSQKGREGEIAKGMSGVIQARGGDVNDSKQMGRLAETLRKVFVQTGAGPAETLAEMQKIFAGMPQDMRKAITESGVANLAVAGQVGGPNATKFLEEYLGKSPIARMAFEAQGGKGVFTNKGIDVDKFEKFFKSITARVGGDPRMAAQTLGLSEDAAEGFVRLGENIKRVGAAEEQFAHITGNLNEQFRKSMGLAESFRANINKIKSMISEPLAHATQGISSALSTASETTGGAAAVTGGAAIGAALLAGGALKAIGGALGKGGVGGAAGALAGTGMALAKSQAAEQIFGAKTVPVYVVNIDELGGGGVLGGLGQTLGGAGAGAAGAAGGIGTMGMLGIGAVAALGVGGVVAGVNYAQGLKTEKTPENDESLIKTVEKYPQLLKDEDTKSRYEQAIKARKQRADPTGLNSGGSIGVAGGASAVGDTRTMGVAPPPVVKVDVAPNVQRSPGAVGGQAPAAAPTQTVKHVIELNRRDLKDSKQPSRGASY